MKLTHKNNKLLLIWFAIWAFITNKSVNIAVFTFSLVTFIMYILFCNAGVINAYLKWFYILGGLTLLPALGAVVIAVFMGNKWEDEKGTNTYEK